MGLTVGDDFPRGVQFKHVPIDWADLSVLNPLQCDRPQVLELDGVVTTGKTVVVGVPGAFTPTCTETHIPGYLSKLAQLKHAGVDSLVVYTGNDAFVVSAWGKLLLASAHLDAGDANAAYPKVYFASDGDAKYSESIGLLKGPGRPVRHAAIIDAGKVAWFAHETESGVHVSGVDSVLAALAQ
ncbi:hypothetical protein DIURU_004615 [Diutina rugosa]|uniref:Redoxin domain-containing protein n=1 Tax=Diutina rugosa TaxID=5481 RepID=A0A642UGG9_DIURU|nr:uncharacterized protein DIURU_004615 [Diutina rugosa]KAA8898595.1 hypothetical protein DIURU_004615 [Diutina rugosa]